jgi:hypothetical protein
VQIRLCLRDLSSSIGIALLLFPVFIAPGCAPQRIGGSTPVDQVIDTLRQDNQRLTQQAADQDHKLDLQRRQIDALQQQLVTTRPALAGINPADLPHLVGVKFDDMTGAVAEPSGLVLRLYVQPFDQQGRFIVVLAEAKAQAVWLQPGAAPVVLGEAVFHALEFDKAYRDLFTGTHYTLDLPLQSVPAGATEATLKLALTDAATGVTVTCQMQVPLAPLASATQPAPAR